MHHIIFHQHVHNEEEGEDNGEKRCLERLAGGNLFVMCEQKLCCAELTNFILCSKQNKKEERRKAMSGKISRRSCRELTSQTRKERGVFSPS